MKNKYAKVRVETLPLDKLQAADYNPRSISNEAIGGLAHSMARLGVVEFPVINKRKDGYRIVGGHQRIEALKRAGETEVKCVIVEFDDAREREANLALNNRAIQGEFVPALTKALIEDVAKLLGPSGAVEMSELRLDSLAKQVLRDMRPTVGVDDVETAGNADDDDEVSIPRSASVSKLGQFYKIGNHVLYCGKMGGAASLQGFPVDRAEMGFTYAPMEKAMTPEFVDSWVASLVANVDGAIYLACASENLALVQRRFEALGGHWSNTLVWFSPESKADHADAYRAVAIPILYGWREGCAHYFCGQRDQGNVFKMKRAPKATLPVEVVTKLILNSSKQGSTILDPNVGKGATLIAAEKTKRNLIGYVWNARDMDAVRKRWCEFAMPNGTNWRSATPEIA